MKLETKSAALNFIDLARSVLKADGTASAVEIDNDLKMIQDALQNNEIRDEVLTEHDKTVKASEKRARVIDVQKFHKENGDPRE